MTPLSAATDLLGVSTQTWAQTSFLATDSEPVLDNEPIRDAREALRAADQAMDPRSQRHALDRLARHLRQQAQQRGHTSVPKRTPYVMAGNERGSEAHVLVIEEMVLPRACYELLGRSINDFSATS